MHIHWDMPQPCNSGKIIIAISYYGPFLVFIIHRFCPVFLGTNRMCHFSPPVPAIPGQAPWPKTGHLGDSGHQHVSERCHGSESFDSISGGTDHGMYSIGSSDGYLVRMAYLDVPGKLGSMVRINGLFHLLIK